MMERMRSMASGWVAKLFMGLLVLSFAVWGIADIFRNFGATAIATIGEAEIDVRDYRTELNRQVRNLSSRLGQNLTISQSAAFGLPNQVLGQMIGDATLDALAIRYNLGLSSQKLATSIASEPSFQSLGKFDRDYMRQVLNANGTTEDRYVTQKGAEERRSQLIAGLTGKANLPDAALKVFNSFSFETRDINYLTLKEETLGEIDNPTSEQLAKFYEAKKLNFRAPEYRSFELVKLEPGDIADPDSVSDEDVQSYYETAANRFVQPEKRNVQQILFANEEEAKTASQKIKAGASFESIIEERNLKIDDVDFGLLSKEEVTDPDAGEAVFSLDVNEVSDVVKGRFGFLLLRATEIKPTQTAPLADVKDQLKAEIAAERAKDEVLDLFDNIEDERAGGATLKEVANKFDLKLRLISDISKTGDMETGDQLTDLPEQQKLLQTIFETEIDYEADPIDVADTGFVWFMVTDVKPSRDRSLDEVKDKVITAWKDDELANRNANLAAEILKELKSGKSLNAIATERSLTVQSVANQTRQSGDPLPKTAIEQAFNGPLNHKATAAGDASQYVLEVVKVTEPDFDPESLQLDALRRTLEQNAEIDLLSQLVGSLQREIGYSVNQPLLNQVVGSTR